MDGITPVGAEVQPPNIGQGLNTLSSILGLSQQQIAIKQQQQALAAQTAEAAQEQQKNSELQQAQQLSLSVKNGQFLNPDGTLDRQALADKLTQVGPYAQASANQVLAQANEIAQNRLAKQQLSQNVQNQLGQGLTGLASDPNTTPQDVKEWVSSQIAAHPNDPQFRDYMLSMAMHFPSQAPANVQHQILQRWAAEYSGQPLETPTQVNTGANLIPGATNRFTGAFSPSATGQPVASVPMQLTPAQQLPQPVTLPTGQIANRQPVSGALTMPPGTPVPGEVPNIPSAAVATQADDNTRYQQISNAAQLSQTAQNLARHVANLAEGVQTGKMSGEITDWLTAIRQHDPGLTDRQLLAKYAAQLQTMALGAAGGDTDLSRGVVLHGMPDPSNMGPDAIADAAHYMLGYFGMLSARNAVATNYVRAHGGSPVGLRANIDSQFMNNANPDVFTYLNMQPGSERQAWLRRHGYANPTANKQLRTELEAMKQYGIQ